MSVSNGTTMPISGNWTPTADQFFCQLTRDESQCFTSAQFAAQPFKELCPSLDCWTDCRDLERLYSPFPSDITFTNATEYGTPGPVTLWPLCAAIANISEAIDHNVASEVDTKTLRPFFANHSRQNQLWAAARATQYWTDTCDAARNSEFCRDKCAAANLTRVAL
jgi:hypothetical protein